MSQWDAHRIETDPHEAKAERMWEENQGNSGSSNDSESEGLFESIGKFFSNLFR